MIDALGRVRLTPEQDPMVLATIRDLGGIDLTARQIADAIGYRCSAKPPHHVDVLGRLNSLRHRGKVDRHDGAHRGGWMLSPSFREFGASESVSPSTNPPQTSEGTE